VNYKRWKFFGILIEQVTDPGCDAFTCRTIMLRVVFGMQEDLVKI